MPSTTIDSLLILWFALTALSVVFMAWDLFTRTPEMRVMKWGWLLVALYMGPIALIVYWISCREPSPGTHEKFVAPLWKQTVGSTIHCLAGDATGVIVCAALVNRMRLGMAVEATIEYLAGFGFGLFIFQALFMRDMLGGSYLQAVRKTILPEWLSMNAVMAGMVPVMVILMSRDMTSMHATSLRFWGVMSLATTVGAVLAFPINWWLVANSLKHGMGTERALGKGGAATMVMSGEAMAGHEMARPEGTAMPVHEKGGPAGGSGPVSAPGAHVSVLQKAIAAALTVAMLAGGVLVAARYGGMHSKMPVHEMPMQSME